MGGSIVKSNMNNQIPNLDLEPWFYVFKLWRQRYRTNNSSYRIRDRIELTPGHHIFTMASYVNFTDKNLLPFEIPAYTHYVKNCSFITPQFYSSPGKTSPSYNYSKEIKKFLIWLKVNGLIKSYAKKGKVYKITPSTIEEIGNLKSKWINKSTKITNRSIDIFNLHKRKRKLRHENTIYQKYRYYSFNSFYKKAIRFLSNDNIEKIDFYRRNRYIYRVHTNFRVLSYLNPAYDSKIAKKKKKLDSLVLKAYEACKFSKPLY